MNFTFNYIKSPLLFIACGRHNQDWVHCESICLLSPSLITCNSSVVGPPSREHQNIWRTKDSFKVSVLQNNIQIATYRESHHPLLCSIPAWPLGMVGLLSVLASVPAVTGVLTSPAGFLCQSLAEFPRKLFIFLDCVICFPFTTLWVSIGECGWRCEDLPWFLEEQELLPRSKQGGSSAHDGAPDGLILGRLFRVHVLK